MVLTPATLNECFHDHGIAGEHISSDERELLGLVVVIRIFGVLDGVLDQLLERVTLANEFNELRVAATAAEHYKPVLLVEELLNGAALLLVEQLIDLYVSSLIENKV